MKKRILILTAAMLLTGCAKGATPLKKGSADEKVELQGGLKLTSVKNIYEFPEKEYQHITLMGNAVKTANIESLYEFTPKATVYDYTSRLDELGSALIEDYDSSLWEITEDTSPNAIYEIVAAEYPDGGGILVGNNTFIYPLDVYQRMGDVESDSLMYFSPYSDNFPEGTMSEVQSFAEKIFSAMGWENPVCSGAKYYEDKNAWVLDYSQRPFGLPFSLFGHRYDNGASGNVLTDQTSETAPVFEMIVGYSEKEGMFFRTSWVNYDNCEITKSYDKGVSLESALEFVDNNIAKNSNYDLLNAELKYLIYRKETQTLENGNKVSQLSAAPVWEFELENPVQNRNYLCIINAVDGSYSFVKAKERETQ